MAKLSLSHSLGLCVLVTSIALPAQCDPPSAHAQAAAAGYGSSSNSASPTGPSAPGPSTPAPADPAGPSSPGPMGPTADAPKPSGNTSTPRPGGVSAPAPRGTTTPRRGLALTFERQATSKARLKVDWKFPVAKPKATGGTAAFGALPLAEAIDVLWENDERPLLVLRECRLCQDSDDALLNRSMNNDRTQLLSKWFRTVRLPAHVMEPTHPLYNVFAGYEWKGKTPHFFLLAHPGAAPVAFSGTQTQADLWRGMSEVISQRYSKDSARAVKDWLALLERFDMLDARRSQLEERLGEVRATDGPDSDKARKLVADLQKNTEERADAEAREKRIMDLGLLKMPRATVAAGN